jgi:hypothetical protein
MTRFIVHLYREMRLSYTDVEADTPEAAASITRDRPTGDACDIDDCEGETFDACVDVAGDEEYEHSRWIDFEAERVRKAAPKLLAALEKCAGLLADYDKHPGEEGIAYREAIAAIAEAKTAGITPSGPVPAVPPSRFEVEHDPQENPDRAYVLVDGTFDVAIIRTAEGIVIDVYPKDGFETIATAYAFDSDAEQEPSTH